MTDSILLFALHMYMELMTRAAKVLGSRPGVLNLHLGTDVSQTDGEDAPKMTMLYKVESGTLDEIHYGLNLAKVVGFPDTFLDVAKTTSDMLKRQIEEKKENSQFQKLKRRRHLILQLHETLKQMNEGDMDDAALGSFLVKLQNEFAERMHGIESRGYEVVTDDDESSSGQGSRASSVDETLAEQSSML